MVASDSAGSAIGTPSTAEVRPFSAAFCRSQPASTSAAVVAVAGRAGGRAEDVRVPAYQLGGDVSRDVVDRPRVLAVLGGDPRVEDDLQQQVAELLAQVARGRRCSIASSVS